jgi:hypothetical protein
MVEYVYMSVFVTVEEWSMLVLVEERRRVGVCFFYECGCECVGKAKRSEDVSESEKKRESTRTDRPLILCGHCKEQFRHLRHTPS